jgi:hypothetical protein
LFRFHINKLTLNKFHNCFLKNKIKREEQDPPLKCNSCESTG